MADQPVCPIIYVRGFAGGTSSIDQADDDPFDGFNSGATHVRVGGDGQPQFYQFEGPLVRLMEDEDYRVVVHGGQNAYLASVADGSQPQNSVWIYRYYDAAADTFGTPATPFDLPTAADGLLRFADQVRAKTGAGKVWLVAHSMGGLICRSMIQKACPDKQRDARDIIDKLFTYATPHNGIEFSVLGLNLSVPQIAPFSAEVFNHDVMYGYLTPQAELDKAPHRPADWDARQLYGSFDPARVFCLVGTDAGDYGLVSKAVGPKSDGLVQVDNAYVRDASRAFVHRSHSGRYGEVNSEEGYQNLRRFLFGSRRATVSLDGAQLPAHSSADPDVTDVWQAEVQVSVRGLPVLLNDRTAGHYCPVELGSVASAGARQAPRPQDDDVTDDSPPAGGAAAPVSLAAVFLLDPGRSAEMQRENLAPQFPSSPRCRYYLYLSVLHLQEQHGLFLWHDHLEKLPEWDDSLIVDVGPRDDADQGEHLWAQWQTANPAVTSAKDPIGDQPRQPDVPGSMQFTIPLPAAGQQLLGQRASIRISVEQA
jgi:pimeloyl-ACP methyl ester carboxylesterase